MKKFNISLFMIIGLFTSMAFAQTYTISGTVKDVNGESIFGASVVISGTVQGDAAGVDGSFAIEDVAPGNYTLRVSAIGYSSLEQDVTVSSSDVVLNFVLDPESETLEELKVFASRSDQSTPVAYSDISKEDIQTELASRDIPEVLNIAPSVYSTNQGGGAGDARINVRGFSQRNTAVMINGVPVNDMENGWVYWSNWDGVGDVAGSIQLQRGISNVNLAVPSVGGTINVLTEPAATQAGGSVKFENGSGSFEKTTVQLNSGLINDKFAVAFVGVRKKGDGLVDGTWTDAWAYHLAASYIVNEDNRLDLFALGAPQRHGQNLYKGNIASFSHEFARDLDDYDVAAFEDYPERGRFFNQNVIPVDPSYGGKQYIGDRWTGPSVQDRFNSSYINERENFFHKPQVNLNWYSNLSDNVTLTNVLYYSGGRGGGTGNYGRVEYDYSQGNPRVLDYNATIAENKEIGVGGYDDDAGILRNSRNNQWTIGNILKLNVQANENVTFDFGIDWRTAEIEHYREVRDLLGLTAYIDNSDQFNPNKVVGLGDKIAYNYTNTVDWFGGYAQAEYDTDALTAYGMFGLSSVKYGTTNFFRKNANGGRIEAETDNIPGFQTKAGIRLGASETFDVYANLGYISKVPILDGAISDYNGAVNPDPENEKYTFFEVGTRIFDNSGRFGMNVNFYFTDRKDRSFTRGVTLEDGTDGIVNITGLDQRHIGLEIESSFQATDNLRLDFMTSFAEWKYLNDVSATYQEDLGDPSSVSDINLYVKDLKVANAPQTQFSYAATWSPFSSFSATIRGFTYAKHYSDFSPLGRTDANDRAQAWKVPNATFFNLHLDYTLTSILDGTQVFFNMLNVTDEVYIQDATDNSRYNAYDLDHDADDAEVFFGLPRRYNFGLRVNF
ncbi:MAG: TonB-dependent receptor [Balneolaceae bacterium]|nr:TonB-dependent receptor [Balneolaceae bacterium]